MKAVIYARFSSDRQDEASIAAQVRACREYAARNGMEIINIYADEAISGKGSKTASRAQYQKMLRDADKGLFSVVLIHKYDRITRSLAEHVSLEARLKARQISLVAVDQDFGTTNEAKIMRTLMWSLSEYYIDNLAAETKKGHRETALKGLHNGGVAPFGYDVVDQHYVINELEAAFVRQVFDAAAERKGFKTLIEAFANAGVTGKRGKPIKYPQIYEMLRNEKYTGVYAYSLTEAERRADRRDKPDAIRIEDALPAIISKEQFQEVRKIMEGRKQTGKKAGYLCSGLVYCSCGAKMHAIKTHRKGHEYAYYYCSKKCGAPVVHMAEADHAAREYLHTLLSPVNQQRITEALRQYQAEGDNRIEAFQEALQRRISAKQREYDTLMKNLSAGVLPPEIVAEIGERMQTIKDEVAQLHEVEPPEDFTVEQITAWLDALKANPDDKAVRLLIERMDVVRAKEKTEFKMSSTLNSVLGENGCGGLRRSAFKILD